MNRIYFSFKLCPSIFNRPENCKIAIYENIYIYLTLNCELQLTCKIGRYL